MAGDANTEFLDALVRHQIYLMRYSGSLRDQLLKILVATENDIEAAIMNRLAAAKGFDTQSASRLRVLQGMIQRIRDPAWNEITDTWFQHLNELAKKETQFTSGALQTVAPVVVDTVLPTVSQLKAIVKSKPFEGQVLGDWASEIQRRDLSMIMKQIQVGMVQNETNAQIASRVVGTQAMAYSDGVTEMTRRNVEAITRTAVNFVSNAARAEFIQQNSDIFSEEQFVATLDARTTPICRANDGKRFPIGSGPIPPLHFGCRSTRVAVIDGAVLGERPMKPFTEKQLVQEYSANKDFADEVTTRDDLPHGHKGSFDDFKRQRVRELTGTVPSDVTYQTFLERQSNSFQDDVLGKTRAILFRKGDVKLDRFVNRKGDQINLHELMLKNRQAFVDAGLNPTDF